MPAATNDKIIYMMKWYWWHDGMMINLIVWWYDHLPSELNLASRLGKTPSTTKMTSWSPQNRQIEAILYSDNTLIMVSTCKAVVCWEWPGGGEGQPATVTEMSRSYKKKLHKAWNILIKEFSHPFKSLVSNSNCRSKRYEITKVKVQGLHLKCLKSLLNCQNVTSADRKFALESSYSSLWSTSALCIFQICEAHPNSQV